MADTSAVNMREALERSGFSAQGWREFWRCAWTRARDNSSPFSRRGSSTISWIVAAGGCGLLLLSAHRQVAPAALLSWGVWFCLVSAWTYLHQGLIQSPDGEPFTRFLLPNGLSFMRLSLAPLAADPILVQPSSGPRWLPLGFLALLALTDLADGQLARRLEQRSRLGAVLDPLADLALLSWLAFGLYRAGTLIPLVLVLIIVRWPGALLLNAGLYVYRGARPGPSSILGKAITAITSVSLFGLAAGLILRPAWLSAGVIEVIADALVLLLVVSILAQGRRALSAAKRSTAQPSGSSPDGSIAQSSASSPDGSSSGRTRPA